MDAVLARKGIAEFVGTALLLGSAVGGGKAAAATGAPPHIALLLGTLAAAVTLFTVLHALGPISGGHVNPAVTISMFVTRNIDAPAAALYILAQFAGGALGALGANAIWESTLVVGTASGNLTTASFAAEILATCGLVGAIHGAVLGGAANRLPMIVPAAVMAASFASPFGMANPAVALNAGVIAGGLSAVSIGVLVVAELIACGGVALAVAWLYGPLASAGAPSRQVFDVELGSAGDDAAPETVLDAVKAAVRPNDIVVAGSAGRVRLIIEDATDDDVADIGHRIEATVQLALAQVGELAGPEVKLVPVTA